MWLINTSTLQLREFTDESLAKPYAILSHTWGFKHEEVSFTDLNQDANVTQKAGYYKVQFLCGEARKDGLHYAWMDTCCINRESSAELGEAINSMYRWYAEASICYAYLEDLQSVHTRVGQHDQADWADALKQCKWFTRGWTLQELIAPKTVHFFGPSQDASGCWESLGTKMALIKELSDLTGIDGNVLSHRKALSSVSVAKRMSWAAKRQTSRQEDRAYSLIGLFEVSMPMLYGEGSEKAFIRLQERIMTQCADHSIFAWASGPPAHQKRLLAISPDDFASSQDVVTWGTPEAFEMTNRGLRLTTDLVAKGTVIEEQSSGARRGRFRGEYVAVLNCRREGNSTSTLGLRLRKYVDDDHYYVNVEPLSEYGVPYEALTDEQRSRTEMKPSRILEMDQELWDKTTSHSVLHITRLQEWRPSLPRFQVRLTPPGFCSIEGYPRKRWDRNRRSMPSPGGAQVRIAMLCHLKKRSVLFVFGYNESPCANDCAWAEFQKLQYERWEYGGPAQANQMESSQMTPAIRGYLMPKEDVVSAELLDSLHARPEYDWPGDYPCQDLTIGAGTVLPSKTEVAVPGANYSVGASIKLKKILGEAVFVVDICKLHLLDGLAKL